MTVNFYKKSYPDFKDELIASESAQFPPQKGQYVKLKGQMFTVSKVIFDADTRNYDIHLTRA